MLIAGNWKAYVEDAGKAKKLAAAAKKLAASGEHQIVVAPAAPHLGMLALGNRSKLAFAAQDVSATTGGAHTGEISAQTLQGAGIAYAIVGHSERRAMGETDAVIAEKLQHALAHALTPILCVGETARDDGAEYLAVIRRQVATAFQPLSPKERLQVIVAYEPVWAIGKTAADAITSADLGEMVDTLYVRAALGALGLARKAGSVVLGAVKVEDAVRNGAALLVLHAREASGDGGRRIASARRATVHVDGPDIPAYKLFSEAELGLAFGGTNVIHAAVLAEAAGRAASRRVVALDRFRGGTPEEDLEVAAVTDAVGAAGSAAAKDME